MRRAEAMRREAERNRHRDEREKEKELELIRKQYLVRAPCASFCGLDLADGMCSGAHDDKNACLQLTEHLCTHAGVRLALQ